MTSWLTADFTSYGPTTELLGGDLYEPRTCRCGGDENTGHYGDCTWAVFEEPEVPAW